MCGINGIVTRDGSRVDAAQIVAMRDTMLHRGPDDEGVWVSGDGRAGLGHRRLSIIDLSPAGRAPMGNEDGTVQVTFNGEIYNHAELRADLERRGHRFRSTCDTEVLVHLWEEHGEAMVELLFGMFAFVIYDARSGHAFAARDRLGIKPLYWVDDGRRFAFASEIKALLPLLPRREVDPVALSHYLTFVAVPPPRTLFAGVSKLAPATTLLVHPDGRRVERRYWDPLENRARFDGQVEDWEAEVRARLERSVRRRMMSDVPVGVFLSGGVDSSTNVAMMSTLNDDPVDSFSIGFEGAEDFNEFDWARRIAKQYGTAHHEVTIDHDDLWRFLPDLVFHQDEPIADPVCVPLHFVSKLAKESGVTVVHVGEGADEIFAGYPTYVQAAAIEARYWPRLRSLPRPVRRALAAAGTAALPLAPGREIEVEALRRAAQPGSRLWWGGAVAYYEHGFDRITTPELRSRLDGGPAPRDVVAGIAADADRHGARDDLDRLIYQDLRLRLPELLLMRVDKLTMANSIEARVPFLDHELVELAMSIPREEKIRDGVGKHVLKRAVSDLLPSDVVWRPKQGFGAPVAQWFRGPLGGRLEARLDESALNELGYVDREAVRDVLDVHRSGRADRHFQLWNILNLAEWFDHWIAGREPAER
jgi:asparagine synthase (glutamine-hydrolysing)